MPQVIVPAYNPPIEGSRSAIVYENAETVAGAAEIKMIIGPDVPLRRQTEIMNGLQFLVDGIRNRNLLDVQFNGAPMTTAVNIDAITASNRRTASDLLLVNFAPTDLAISMGATATAAGQLTSLDTAFEAMKKILLENIKDQVAA